MLVRGVELRPPPGTAWARSYEFTIQFYRDGELAYSWSGRLGVYSPPGGPAGRVTFDRPFYASKVSVRICYLGHVKDILVFLGWPEVAVEIPTVPPECRELTVSLAIPPSVWTATATAGALVGGVAGLIVNPKEPLTPSLAGAALGAGAFCGITYAAERGIIPEAAPSLATGLTPILLILEIIGAGELSKRR